MYRISQQRVLQSFESIHVPEIALAAAVVTQAIFDLQKTRPNSLARQDAKQFFESGWFESLCDGIGWNPYHIKGLLRE